MKKPGDEVFHTWWKAKTLGSRWNGVQGKTIYPLALETKGKLLPRELKPYINLHLSLRCTHHLHWLGTLIEPAKHWEKNTLRSTSFVVSGVTLMQNNSRTDSPTEIFKGNSIHNLKWQIWEETIDFPGGIVVKNQPANAGGVRDASSIPGLGKYPGKGNGNPL